MTGAPGRKTSGEVAYGPIVLYSLMYNKIGFVDDVFGVNDKGRVEALHAIARGEGNAPVEGPEVFEKLTMMFLENAARKEGKYSLR